MMNLKIQMNIGFTWKILFSNEIKALIATAALGMGYDKPDLGFVIHYQAPASIILLSASWSCRTGHKKIS